MKARHMRLAIDLELSALVDRGAVRNPRLELIDRRLAERADQVADRIRCVHRADIGVGSAEVVPHRGQQQRTREAGETERDGRRHRQPENGLERRRAVL
jgi:hypothetical protein